LIEGLKPVLSALQSSLSIVKILIVPGREADWPQDLYAQTKLKNIPVQEVTIADIESISSLKNPEGLIAIADLPQSVWTPETELLFPALYLWKINDPGNLGTLLRTALWFGVRTVLISPESVDVYAPKVGRGAMGALFQLTVYPDVPWEALAARLARDNVQLIGSATHGIPAETVIYRDKWLLVCGSESHGLPEEILQQTETVIGIQKPGSGESLNVGVALGILLNIIQRQKGENL